MTPFPCILPCMSLIQKPMSSSCKVHHPLVICISLEELDRDEGTVLLLSEAGAGVYNIQSKFKDRPDAHATSVPQ